MKKEKYIQQSDFDFSKKKKKNQPYILPLIFELVFFILFFGFLIFLEPNTNIKPPPLSFDPIEKSLGKEESMKINNSGLNFNEHTQINSK